MQHATTETPWGAGETSTRRAASARDGSETAGAVRTDMAALAIVMAETGLLRLLLLLRSS